MPEYQVTGVRAATPEEEQLATWLKEQELKSPDHLEATARQIITLVTGLIGLLLGVITLTKEPLPAYMNLSIIRPLAVMSVVALLVALLSSLLVIWPRRWRVSAANIDAQQRAFQDILRHKTRWLNLSMFSFFVGVASLATILITAIVHR